MKEEENCGCSTTTVCRKIKSEDLRVRKKLNVPKWSVVMAVSCLRV